MTIHEAQQKLLFQLYHIYDNAEAAAIVNLVMENITDWKKVDRILNKNVPLSNPQLELFEKYSAALMMHEPVQYVLHEAWFCGMKFYVDENVLIPRPETEELVDWIVQELSSEQRGMGNNKQDPPLIMLDIGTGSGSVPIALKKKLDHAIIYSCDISKNALQVAKQNASSNAADVHFIDLDFLNKEDRSQLPSCHIIVSNPPYIPLLEKNSLAEHVKNFEPHTALFVNDNDPLVFYKAIADFAAEKLLLPGRIYVETHEELAGNVKKLFLQKGFDEVTIKKDIYGKDRMLKATMLL